MVVKYWIFVQWITQGTKTEGDIWRWESTLPFRYARALQGLLPLLLGQVQYERSRVYVLYDAVSISVMEYRMAGWLGTAHRSRYKPVNRLKGLRLTMRLYSSSSREVQIIAARIRSQERQCEICSEQRGLLCQFSSHQLHCTNQSTEMHTLSLMMACVPWELCLIPPTRREGEPGSTRHTWCPR
jgi:hypothetical protein